MVTGSFAGGQRERGMENRECERAEGGHGGDLGSSKPWETLIFNNS